jgi:hypothetical protein
LHVLAYDSRRAIVFYYHFLFMMGHGDPTTTHDDARDRFRQETEVVVAGLLFGSGSV